MKKLLIILTAAALLLTSCSDLKSRLQGKWRLNRVDGLSIEEYTEKNGLDASALDQVWIISGDEVTVQVGSVSLYDGADIEYVNGGFEFEDKTVIGGGAVLYDAAEQTLTFVSEVNGKKTEHVLVKE